MNIKEWPCWAKVGVGVGLAVFVLNWPSTSSEWAAWVQAFGTIGAIWAGFALLRMQMSSQEKQREEKERVAEKRLILNLKTEIQVNWDLFERSWGKSINELNDDECLDVFFDNPGWRFPVYEACSSQLGLIKLDKDRKLIIECYAKANGFLLNLMIHNDLLRAREKAESAFGLGSGLEMERLNSEIRHQEFTKELKRGLVELREIKIRVDKLT